MCGCECCISEKYAFVSLNMAGLLSEKLRDQSKNAQNIRSGKIASSIYETYKNSVMQHGHHIYKTAAYIAISEMCDFPYNQHALLDWKCVLQYFSTCPSILIHNQELHNMNKTISPTT